MHAQDGLHHSQSFSVCCTQRDSVHLLNSFCMRVYPGAHCQLHATLGVHSAPSSGMVSLTHAAQCAFSNRVHGVKNVPGVHAAAVTDAQGVHAMSSERK